MIRCHVNRLHPPRLGILVRKHYGPTGFVRELWIYWGKVLAVLGMLHDIDHSFLDQVLVQLEVLCLECHFALEVSNVECMAWLGRYNLGHQLIKSYCNNRGNTKLSPRFSIKEI